MGRVALSEAQRASYGQDAPSIVLGAVVALVAGAALIVIGLVATLSGAVEVPLWSLYLGFALLVAGTIGAGLLLRLATRTKTRDRDALLRLLTVDGPGRLLDVGCGRGLLLLPALAHTPGATGVGVDLPRVLESGTGTVDRFLSNAAAEGVTGRAALVAADGRVLPFPDATFDVVMSRAMLASLRSSDSFHEALVEMTRVLKPGGQLALVVTDGWRMPRYGEVLEGGGFTSEIERTPGFFHTPIVVARKAVAPPPSP